MGNKEEVIKRYLADMIALERYVKQASEGQLEKGRFGTHLEARDAVRRMRTVSSEHLDRLGEEVARMGGEPTKSIKETVAGAAGSIVDLVQRLRTEPESKMLRDHYAMLGVVRIGYIALHTTGLALREPMISGMALRHLADLSPLIPELEEAMVKVVAPELRQEVDDVDENVVDQAVQAIQESRKAA